MNYFVTGGTGFLGHNLIDCLLRRKGVIYVLVRPGSKAKLDSLKARWGEEGKRVIGVTGDLSKPNLGMSSVQRKKLEGSILHVFHLAAIYDLKADAASQELANIGGTVNAVGFAKSVKAKRFHHVSSIAAAGSPARRAMSPRKKGTSGSSSPTRS